MQAGARRLRPYRSIVFACGAALSSCGTGVGLEAAFADTLTVGSGCAYARPEQANAVAKPGDIIQVYPAEGDGVYHKVALRIVTPRVRWMGTTEPGRPVVLDGEGFDYSGRGAVPRAIVQFDPGADGSEILNFELRGAVNDSHNAAGIRINQAGRVTIRRCDIHHNQMGIMSNGGPDGKAEEQAILNCVIHHNGDTADPGYNHNLYLGGDSVMVGGCDIFASTTGHNVKSRARFNLFTFNHVHDSANREFDIVDSDASALAHADAVWIGNLIVKADPIAGNTNVIHFGQDMGGVRRGSAWLINNTMVTPYVGPVVRVSTTPAAVRLVNNVIYNPRQRAATLLEGVDPRTALSGAHNWLSMGYGSSSASLDPASTWVGSDLLDTPGFANESAGVFGLSTVDAARWRADPQPLRFLGIDLAGPRASATIGMRAVVFQDIAPFIGAPCRPHAAVHP